MAARGQELKNQIVNKILEVFPNSFINGKEIRICGNENGEEVQIKVTLTAAKENIVNEAVEKPTIAATTTPSTDDYTVEITSKEKRTVAEMLAALNL